MRLELPPLTERFLAFLRYEKRYSPHTLTAYTNDLRQFIQFLVEQFDWEVAKHQLAGHQQVRSWMISLMESGVGPRSINRKLSSLKTYYKFLLKQGEIQVDPMKKVIAPKTPDRLPAYVEAQRMEQLFTLLDKEQALLSEEERFPKLRNRLILELLYGTGIRRAELIGLKTADLDLNGGLVKVTGKGSKERLLPLGKHLTELIESYQALRKRLFEQKEPSLLISDKGKKLYPKFVYRLVNKYLYLVTTAEKRSPHVLRHTFATHLSNNGADLGAIKELLGHGSLASTQVYTHNSIARLKEIHKKAHPRAEEH